MEITDLLPMSPTEGPPLPRILGQRWPDKNPISKKRLQELIDEVPDVNDPDIINYWVKVDGTMVYLEGWCDKCLISTGFPTIERGNHEEKIAYIEDMTEQTLEKKAKERGLRLIRGGFVELPDAVNLYGVSYGIYEKAE